MRDRASVKTSPKVGAWLPFRLSWIASEIPESSSRDLPSRVPWSRCQPRGAPTDGGGLPQHRVLIASRNLTFDRSWDTVVRLEQAASGARLAQNVRKLAVGGATVHQRTDHGDRDLHTRQSARIRHAQPGPAIGKTVAA